MELADDLQTARDFVQTSTYMRRGAVLEQYRPGVEDLYIAIRTYPELQLSLLERPRPRAEGIQDTGDGQSMATSRSIWNSGARTAQRARFPLSCQRRSPSSPRNQMAEEIASRPTG